MKIRPNIMFRRYIQTDLVLSKIKTSLDNRSYFKRPRRKQEHAMNAFDLFVNEYPPGSDLRRPTAGMLEQFRGDYISIRSLSLVEME